MSHTGIQTRLFGEAATVSPTPKPRKFSPLSTPLESPLLRLLSLGVGLQSVTLAFMSEHGNLPPLDAAIFSDTGGEKRATYEYLEYLRANVSFPIIETKRQGPSLGEYALASVNLAKQGRSQLPLHTKDPDGMLPKQCNSDWKKRPTHRVIKQMVRAKTGQSRLPKAPVVELWLGMTMDELNRMSVCEHAYVHHRYPLTEMLMKRPQCEPWLLERGRRVPPKSSCKYCPFQREDQWRDMRDNHPLDFSEAVDFDRDIRVPYQGFEGHAFLFRGRVPLGEADLSTQEDHGQGSVFGCGEDMCGT